MAAEGGQDGELLVRHADELEQDYEGRMGEIARLKRQLQEGEAEAEAEGPDLSLVVQEGSPWRAFWSDSYGCWYFVHGETEETTWEAPEEGVAELPEDYEETLQMHQPLQEQEFGDDDYDADVGYGGYGLMQEQPHTPPEDEDDEEEEDPSPSAYGAPRVVERAAQTKDKLAKLRAERELAELAELRKQPEMNEMSRKLLAGRQQTFEERQKAHLEAKRAKEARLREEMERREAADLVAKPVINERSKRLVKDRNVDDQAEWNEAREVRREVRQQMQELRQAADCTHTPQISRKSKEIVEKRRREGAVPDAPVSERLQRHGQQASAKREERLRQEQTEARAKANPELAEHSASYEQRGDVVNRLYRRAEVHKIKAEIRRQEHMISEMVDESSGQMRYTPKINRSSEAMARRARERMARQTGAATVEDQLALKGQMYERKRIMRERQAEVQERALHERPKTNMRSEMMMYERKVVHNESTSQRLSKPIGHVKESTLQGIEQPSFQPKINKRSTEMLQNQPQFNDAGNGGGGGSAASASLGGGASGGGAAASDEAPAIFKRNQAWAQQRAERQAKEREEKQRQELEECSFQPKMLSSSTKRAGSAGSSESGGGGGDVGERLFSQGQQWAQQRETRLEREREERQRQALAECSFTPSRDGLAPKFKQQQQQQRQARSQRNSQSGRSSNGRHEADEFVDDSEGVYVDEYEDEGDEDYDDSTPPVPAPSTAGLLAGDQRPPQQRYEEDPHARYDALAGYSAAGQGQGSGSGGPDDSYYYDDDDNNNAQSFSGADGIVDDASVTLESLASIPIDGGGGSSSHAGSHEYHQQQQQQQHQFQQQLQQQVMNNAWAAMGQAPPQQQQRQHAPQDLEAEKLRLMMMLQQQQQQPARRQQQPNQPPPWVLQQRQQQQQASVTRGVTASDVARRRQRLQDQRELLQPQQQQQQQQQHPQMHMSQAQQPVDEFASPLLPPSHTNAAARMAQLQQQQQQQQQLQQQQTRARPTRQAPQAPQRAAPFAPQQQQQPQQQQNRTQFDMGQDGAGHYDNDDFSEDEVDAAVAQNEEVPEWQEFTSSQGKPYYYNTRTGESTWRRPF